MAQNALNTDEQTLHSDIALALASAYDIIYLVDTESGQFTQFSTSERFEKLGLTEMKNGDFFDVVNQVAQRAIHNEDRQKLLRVTNKQTLMQELEKNGSVTLTYRQVINGREEYINLLALVPGNDLQHFVVAIRNVDAQVRREQEKEEKSAIYNRLALSLAGRYEIIYDIDIHTGEYIQYDSGSGYGELDINVRGEDFFTNAREDIKSLIHPDDLEKMLREIDRDSLLDSIDKNGSLSLTYRQLINGSYQYVTLLAVRSRSGDDHIIIGVINVDAQQRRVMSIQQKTMTLNRIIQALASHFEVIYCVNICTDEYEQYSASKGFSEFNIAQKGKDFFNESLNNIRIYIYEEDYPLLASAMQKENFLECLGSNGAFTLKYRLMLDGRPQFVTLFAVRAPEDPDHVIIAVVNVDTVTRKEIAIIEARDNAIDMMNHDPLTGLYSKHAYDDKAAELEKQIFNDAAEFSLIIIDVNDLKTVNDSQGHSEGDRQLRAVGRLLSEVFRNCPVYRLGGDEFAVILQGQDNEHGEELIAQLSEKNEHNKLKGKLTLAVGMASYDPLRDNDLGDVFERADRAMYRQKRKLKQQ